MTRWEYKFIVCRHTRATSYKAGGESVESIYQIEAILNAFGAEGWEVAAMTHVGGDAPARLVLKKPIAT